VILKKEKRSFAASLLISMVALMATSVLVPGINIQGLATVFISALVIGFINAIIKPIFTFFTLPLTFMTLGLFLFVINGLMLFLAAALVPGFYVSGFGAAILGSIVVSFINWVINQIF